VQISAMESQLAADRGSKSEWEQKMVFICVYIHVDFYCFAKEPYKRADILQKRPIIGLFCKKWYLSVCIYMLMSIVRLYMYVCVCTVGVYACIYGYDTCM